MSDVTSIALGPRLAAPGAAGSWRAGEGLGNAHPLGGRRAGDHQVSVVEVAALGYGQAEIQGWAADLVGGVVRAPGPGPAAVRGGQDDADRPVRGGAPAVGVGEIPCAHTQ